MTPETWNPRTYQFRMVQFLMANVRGMLGAGAGLGKTVVVLTVLAFLIASKRLGRALVVAPKRVALTVWKQEAEKWLHLGGLDIEVIHGANWRERIVCSKASIVVITYAQLASVQRSTGLYLGVVDLLPHSKWPFDCVVLDESTKIKSPSSELYKAARRLKQWTSRIILMSGTPAPNGLLDLWTQMATVDVAGDILGDLGRSMTVYKEKFFRADYNGWNWEPHPWAPARIHEIASRKMVSLKSDDYLELPPYHVNRVYVDLSKRDMAQYRILEKELFLQLGDVGVEAFNAATLTGKCRQFTSGFLYTDEFGGTNRAPICLHEAKLDAAEDIIEEAAGNPVLLVYDFKQELVMLKGRFGKRLTALAEAKDPAAVIKAWNQGRIPILAIHPKSAGHGLNLQHGGNTVLWYGNTWSSEEYDQTNARLHRTGQKNRVIVHQLIARGTIDEQVYEAVTEKRRVQDVLMEATKLRSAA